MGTEDQKRYYHTVIELLWVHCDPGEIKLLTPGELQKHYEPLRDPENLIYLRIPGNHDLLRTPRGHGMSGSIKYRLEPVFYDCCVFSSSNFIMRVIWNEPAREKRIGKHPECFSMK